MKQFPALSSAMKKPALKQLPILLSLALCLTVLSSHAQHAKVVMENDRMKITEYTSRPGEDVCGKGKHTHADHATILLTDAQVMTTTAEGVKQSETYLAGKHLYTITTNGKTENIPVDGVFWVKGTTHSVVNTGTRPLRFYIIETK